MTPAEFIAAITPAAQASAHITGIPASFTIAQGALESSWGNSKLAEQAHNLFGVKADKSWRGATLEMYTREYIKGEWIVVKAMWRKYPDWLACINDHAAFLTGQPRYRLALTGNRTGEDFARQIQIAGYATDPRYADKVISIIRQYKLDQLDAG